ncbi:MAG TPA: alpha/beta fold hydrolase [Polyangiaceae bacterium]|nr:alpha/beta fold hydrolase [Polyangiaceae bacterium]
MKANTSLVPTRNARGSSRFSRRLLAAIGEVFARFVPRVRLRGETRLLPVPSTATVTGGTRLLPRHPIVLAHGYLGFGGLTRRAFTGRYFRGVREFLESLGCRVFLLSVSPTAGVKIRGEELARQVRALGLSRVNVVAHSMGGLDARWAISNLGLHSRVSSLVTVGTPHRGTPIADLLGHIGLGAGDGLRDLTPESTSAFNENVLDAPDVFYGSFVGASRRVQRFLEPGHSYLNRLSGANDGIVPASSQRWGKVLGKVDADHLAQVGWSRHFDVKMLYSSLVTHVATLGC